MQYKNLYLILKNKFISNKLHKLKNIDLINYFKSISKKYKLQFIYKELSYQDVLYKTYILNCNREKIAFIFTIDKNNEFIITPIDYEYLIDTNILDNSYLLNVFFKSNLNIFTKIAIDNDMYNYQFIKYKQIVNEQNYIKYNNINNLNYIQNIL